MSRSAAQRNNDLVILPTRPRIEAQCEQIFQRASSINKDLINRMQNSPLVKKHVFGLEIKKIWILVTLLLLFSGSLVGTMLFWFTNTFDNYVLNFMAIVNGSSVYNDWRVSKAKPLIKVHIFNYTNVEEFEKGLEMKLRVKELGPCVYEETIERTNIHFESDGTVSYQNVFKHTFVPHLSKAKQNDLVVVPNIMMLSAAKKTEDLDYWTRLATSVTLGGVMKHKPFMKLAAHRFIWGYEDSVYELAKGLMTFQHSDMLEQVGLLSRRNGTSPVVMTVHTGQRGMKNYGIISKVNGFSTIGHWPTDECDSLKATEGALMPPSVIRSKQNFDLYVPDACRKYPYIFEKEVFIINNTIPAYRYKLQESIYDSVDKEPANQCYCDKVSGVCSPQGFYNVSSCVYGAPLFVSMPFFRNVPASDIKVDGIRTYHGDLSSYLDIHPTMGYTMAGVTKFQINVLAKSYQGFYSMDMFDEQGIMLPLAWIESGLDDASINRDYLEIIYMTTFTVKQVELALKYITLLTTLITITAIFIILKPIIHKHEQHHISLQPVRLTA